MVIPGLVRLGYAYEDAVEYTVAACWEFIVPGVGEDIPNIAALSLPGVVDVCLHRDLPSCADYPAFLACVKRELQANATASAMASEKYSPCPLR